MLTGLQLPEPLRSPFPWPLAPHKLQNQRVTSSAAGYKCGGGGSSHPLSVTWMGCKLPTWKAETPPTKSPKNMYRKCCLRKDYGHRTLQNIWWARALESETLENGLGGPPKKYCAKWLCYLAYVHNRVSGHGTVCTLLVEELAWQVPTQCTAQSIQRG